MNKSLILLLLASAFVPGANAQPQVKPYEIKITPDHADWCYGLGDKPVLRVSVLKDNAPVRNAHVKCAIARDAMPVEWQCDTILKDGTATFTLPASKEPGFIALDVAMADNPDYYGRCKVAVDPFKIKPTVKAPDDFMEFWQNAVSENRKLDLDPKMTLIPDRCTSRSLAYNISFQNFRKGSRIYGVLTVPCDPGTYPALLVVPGAGARPYYPVTDAADQGVIRLDIGIHGVPVNLPYNFYSELVNGPLYGYMSLGLDSRDDYYYKRVVLGCLRAVDFLKQLPQCDTTRIAVKGESQGGFLATATAALTPGLKGLVVYHPAMSDQEGYTHGRAGGWPHRLRNDSIEEHRKTINYYDTANFAPYVEAPIYFVVGFNDNVVPPTTSMAVYNSYKAPKEIHTIPIAEHWVYRENRHYAWDWIKNRLAQNR